MSGAGWEMTRRAWLATVPAVALTPFMGRAAAVRASTRRALQIAPIPVTGLHSVTLAVRDVARSVGFYQELFGLPVAARNGRTVVLRIGSGPRFLALSPADGRGPRFVSFGMAVPRFDLDTVVRRLAEHGLEPAPAAGEPAAMGLAVRRRGDTPELFFGDPHGMVVQLHDPRYCAGGGPLGADCGPVERAEAPGSLVLTGFSHFTNNAADPTRSIDFYRAVFGFDIQAYQAASPLLGVGSGDEFLMFIPNSVGRTPEDAARAPGVVHHTCLTVADFEVERVLSALARHGVRARADHGTGPLRHWVTMRMPDRGGAPEGTPELYFSDPDGLSIQLQDARYCGGGGALGELCD